MVMCNSHLSFYAIFHRMFRRENIETIKIVCEDCFYRDYILTCCAVLKVLYTDCPNSSPSLKNQSFHLPVHPLQVTGTCYTSCVQRGLPYTCALSYELFLNEMCKFTDKTFVFGFF